MILDELLMNKKDLINPWIQKIYDYRKLTWWWPRYKFKKSIHKELPNDSILTVKDLNMIAETIQLLAHYYFYPNNEDSSDIWSIKEKGVNILGWCVNDATCELRIRNTNVTFRLYNPVLLDERSWTEATITSVITNRYEKDMFATATEYLIMTFKDALLMYME